VEGRSMEIEEGSNSEGCAHSGSLTLRRALRILLAIQCLSVPLMIVAMSIVNCIGGYTFPFPPPHPPHSHLAKQH
jgi:hypothetical protein